MNFYFKLCYVISRAVIILQIRHHKFTHVYIESRNEPISVSLQLVFKTPVDSVVSSPVRSLQEHRSKCTYTWRSTTEHQGRAISTRRHLDCTGKEESHKIRPSHSSKGKEFEFISHDATYIDIYITYNIWSCKAGDGPKMVWTSVCSVATIASCRQT